MEEIISFLISPSFTGSLLILKIVFLFFIFLFLILIIFLLIKTSWLRVLFLQDLVEFFTYRPYGIKKAARKWKKILSYLERGLESEAKLALIEAEEILDETLKELGYPGETLGERLNKITPDTLPNLDQIWEIHKIRNNIVHDPTYKLSLDEAKKALSVYERALKDLLAI